MRYVVAAAALLTGCSSRPLVDVDDEGDEDTSASLGTPVDDDDVDDDGVDDDRPRPDDDDEAGDVDVDDGLDDDGDTTGQVSECADVDGPDVDVEVLHGLDPADPQYGIVLRDLECTIAGRSDAPGWVQFELECADEVGPLDSLVSIEASFDGLVVPAALAEGTIVQARVYTWRDPVYYDEFRWRRADHFVLYRDGALAFAAGSGAGFPTNLDQEADLAFFAPVLFDTLGTQCPGPAMECHDPRRDAWLVAVGDLGFEGSPFQILQLAGYDIHLGELSTSDSIQCDEPPFSRIGLAIAPW